ncbi:cuticle protein [Holotrichia oblita]|uniref:Cuticle protein n=1 Tax=Holotrichia oblita TaxID=644536 RepID=A0ACB9TGZ8_HOLOL|nr:cuticle protein [Holotrichia oblita]
MCISSEIYENQVKRRPGCTKIIVLCLYRFSHPHVRSRLEKLMGSNVVSLTDRGYMQRLQERILEDYAQNMCKRIATRQAEEMERVKNLVLIGKIPLEHAPPEMANHPVMLIEMYCNKLISERRAKVY